MAITSTPIESYNIPNHIGDKVVTMGTYTTDINGGNIDTGLKICDVMVLTSNDTGLVTSPPLVVSSLPSLGDSIEILSPHSINGIWMAIGEL